MKKVSIWLLVLVLCLAAALTASAQVQDGVYTASAQGKNGPVTVSVTFSSGMLANIEVTAHSETTGLFEETFNTLPSQMIEHQTVEVDLVSGSTMSGQALVNAVKDCIAQAGGTADDFSGKIEKTLSTEVKELRTQVVVVGAGASGLSAAVEAHEAGLDVIVVEKNSSTAQSSSNLAAGLMGVGSQLQEAQGITYNTYDASLTSWEDQADTIFTYWTSQMSRRLNQKLVYNYVHASGADVDWLVAHGFQFIRVVDLQGGYNWYHNGTENYHLLGKGKYSVYAEPMLEKIADEGAQVLFNTKATELVTDENGAVVGLVAVQNDGTTLHIAADAVILATGGFGSDEDYVYNTLHFDGAFEGAGNAGTGDGMRMAWSVGAQKYKEDMLLVHHLFTTAAYTDLSDFGNKMNCILNYVPSFLNLNPVGTRYRNEENVMCGVEASETTNSARYGWNVFTQSMVDGLVNEGTQAIGLPNGLSWVPLSFGYQPKGDEKWTELPTVLARMEQEGVMVKADTLEELAEKTGMTYSIMMKNIAEYNAACEAGHDSIYGKKAELLVSVDAGPYYAMKTKTRYITSIGGLKIDEEMNVLDDNERQIKGLYAVGCDGMADLYGDAYVDIEGAGFGWAFYSGRTAAQTLAEKLKK